MIDPKTNSPDASESKAPEGVAQDPEATPASTCCDGESKSQTLDKPKEIGGRNGPDPTRFGDWEKNGRCVDF
jgi:hypothetical protein